MIRIYSVYRYIFLHTVFMGLAAWLDRPVSSPSVELLNVNVNSQSI